MARQRGKTTLDTNGRQPPSLAPTKVPKQDNKDRPISSHESGDGAASDDNLAHIEKLAKKEMRKDVVLLIEDEQDTAALIRLHLENAGMSVLHVKDGRQAIDIIDNIATPRVVLLDLVVPYFNGFELLKIIRTKPGWEQVPVMVVSGDSYAGDIDRMMREGAEDYVVKSAGVRVIVHRLKQMLEKVA